MVVDVDEVVDDAGLKKKRKKSIPANAPKKKLREDFAQIRPTTGGKSFKTLRSSIASGDGVLYVEDPMSVSYSDFTP